MELFPDGCLASFRAQGHAEDGRYGSNIACAAATQMLRTAARLFSSVRGAVRAGGADAPGDMSLEIAGDADVDREWLRGATDFLLRGLRDLQAEFPREIALSIHE